MKPESVSAKCICHSLGKEIVNEFRNVDALPTHRLVQRRGAPQWWLYLSVCNVCCQAWLVAQEERLNDIYIMLKITDSAAQAIVEASKWPSELDYYETLLELGAAHGHVARYHVPEDALPMVIDLVGQRPEITPKEISTLTNIPQAAAKNLVIRAISEIHEHGYPYPWKARAA